MQLVWDRIQAFRRTPREVQLSLHSCAFLLRGSLTLGGTQSIGLSQGQLISAMVIAYGGCISQGLRFQCPSGWKSSGAAKNWSTTCQKRRRVEKDMYLEHAELFPSLKF